MSTPDYFGEFSKRVGDATHADALNEAADLFSGYNMPLMQQRTGNDPSQINDLIDAQLDKFLATCGGDERLALFCALAMFGQAMHRLSGPRAGGDHR